MANELIPLFYPADTLTGHAEVAVTGKRAVAISGPRVDGNPQVSPAADAEAFFGVAAYDAAAGEKVTIWRVGVVPVTAGAAVTAGQALALNATGQVVAAAPAAGATAAVIGIAVDDAASGADCFVALNPTAIVG